jgi:hypothetical protein
MHWGSSGRRFKSCQPDHLYLECHGQGGPIIVLESDYHDSSDPWNLTDALAIFNWTRQ